ncbi:PaaI family thioesterase [Stakelama marina]|uniref:PaaI family thioesterase n=1 Tax=Stakelama marina TaxID=2826939 RepID=A0A8T4ICA6_9SPHN|nr:PaaI family thioesterase [Stakelama marina]MBR0552668.1 PaaI family thioesterase [Stakelama marina]
MAEDAAPPSFVYEDHPDLPGWKRWQLSDPSRFNSMLGPMAVRIEGKLARVRMTPEHKHSNLSNNVHGGALMGFIDVALFAAGRGFGILTAGTAVTLDLSVQFIGGARIGEDIEARVELLRETGRLLFLRGLIVQGEDGEDIAASFSGTVRKPTRK